MGRLHYTDVQLQAQLRRIQRKAEMSPKEKAEKKKKDEKTDGHTFPYE